MPVMHPVIAHSKPARGINHDLYKYDKISLYNGYCRLWKQLNELSLNLKVV